MKKEEKEFREKFKKTKLSPKEWEEIMNEYLKLQLIELLELRGIIPEEK